MFDVIHYGAYLYVPGNSCWADGAIWHTCDSLAEAEAKADHLSLVYQGTKSRFVVAKV